MPTRGELEARVGDLAAAGGVRAVELTDGVERGIRALEFSTGSGLRFECLVDRALDIGPAEYAGRSFAWHSPTGFRHPGLHEYRDEDGLSWLRSFSGLTVTAGLDHTLFTAEVDASNYHYPFRPAVWNGLHGRVGNIPARLHGYGETWDGDRCVLWAEGEVRQAAVFGEHLRLRRRVEADLFGRTIRLHDVVTNHGYERTPHMYLYHLNLGWPLLDEGARVLAPVRSTLWASDSAITQGSDRTVMPAPRPHVVEQVYEHDLAPDAQGRSRVALVNDALGLGVSVSWGQDQFPCFFQWLHLRAGGYALGLEPSTHHVTGEQAARDDGSMIWLEHGESRTYDTHIEVVDGADGIAALEAAVAASLA
jgi:uncharacterized protein DUF4432